MAQLPNVALGADEWGAVAELLNLDDLVHFAKSCRFGREIARRVMHYCDLSHVPWLIAKQALRDAFLLTASEMKYAKFRTYLYKPAVWRPVTDSLPLVLQIVGGWKGLKARLEKRPEALSTRKRKRDDLMVRQRDAVTLRRRAMDEWLAIDKPLGDAIDSLDKWEASLLDRAGWKFWKHKRFYKMAPNLARSIFRDVVDGDMELYYAKRALVAFDETLDNNAEFRQRIRLGSAFWTDLYKYSVLADYLHEKYGAWSL